MRTVEIELPSRELSRQMAMMRVWLDERRCQPSGFNCRDAVQGVVVQVDFKASSDAEAFAERFGGQVSAALPPHPEPELSASAIPTQGLVG
ncbi:MAG TPA: hypothetical protein VGF07_00800 [Stellaceae bacterium]|jgi:hypothetical protein